MPEALLPGDFPPPRFCDNLFPEPATNPDAGKETDRLKGNHDVRAATRRALNANPPPLSLAKLLDNGEPQATAAGRGAARAIETEKRLKNLISCRFRNTGP